MFKFVRELTVNAAPALTDYIPIATPGVDECKISLVSDVQALVAPSLTATYVGYGSVGNAITGSAGFTFASSILTVPNLIDSGLTASTVVYSNASKQLTSLANSAGVLTNDGAGV